LDRALGGSKRAFLSDMHGHFQAMDIKSMQCADLFVLSENMD
jgi:hypothetical protein